MLISDAATKYLCVLFTISYKPRNTQCNSDDHMTYVLLYSLEIESFTLNVPFTFQSKNILAARPLCLHDDCIKLPEEQREMKLNVDSRALDKFSFRCKSRHQRSIRSGTIFEGSPLFLPVSILILST